VMFAAATAPGLLRGAARVSCSSAQQERTAC
jgi:hypothetical protein